MTRWGMVIDLRKCSGCQTCTIACKIENSLPPDIFWRRVLDFEVGEYPSVKRFFLPIGCMHCANPPCLDVCPTTATRKREDGVVYIDYEKCIGCGYCIVACPYRARSIVKEEKWYFDVPILPEQMGYDRNMVRVCTKCTFCIQRLDQAAFNGKRPGVDPEVTPFCVSTCIGNAIHFGDLSDPDSSVSRLLKENHCIRLLEELGTDPSVYYIIG